MYILSTIAAALTRKRSNLIHHLKHNNVKQYDECMAKKTASTEYAHIQYKEVQCEDRESYAQVYLQINCFKYYYRGKCDNLIGVQLFWSVCPLFSQLIVYSINCQKIVINGHHRVHCDVSNVLFWYLKIQIKYISYRGRLRKTDVRHLRCEISGFLALSMINLPIIWLKVSILQVIVTWILDFTYHPLIFLLSK